MFLGHLDAMFRAAVAAVDPAGLVERALARIEHHGPVVVLALGKAAPGMVRGAHRVFGDSLTGVAVSATAAVLPGGVEGMVGGHPIPDKRSLAAGHRLLAAAAAASDDALVVVLVSGGGSALAEVPAAGVTIAEIAEVNRILLGCGAAIDEINAVRRPLSQIKGGRLGARVRASRLVALAISDVGDADPSTIASGPTLPPPVEEPAAAIVARYGLAEALPASVMRVLETPPSPVVGRSHEFVVLGDGQTAGRAAVAAGAARGLTAVLASGVLAGEARAEARRILTASAGRDADAVVHVGETTVTVSGPGRGGRNHEAALAAAIALDGRPGCFLAAGTDGVDGATAGAGAVVDGATAGIGRRRGLDPTVHLEDNNSGGFFDLVPGRIVTGPTGTNVADVWIAAGRRWLESA